MDTPSVKMLNAAIANADRTVDRTIVGAHVLARFPAHRATVSRLSLTFDSARNSGPETMIAKQCGGDAFASEGIPEIRFYRELSPLAAHLPIPACLGWSIDQEARSTLLLVENLSDRYERITAPVSRHAIELIVEEIAAIHAFFWNHPKLDGNLFAMPRDNETRMPQAKPPAVIEANAAFLEQQLAAFNDGFRAELDPTETGLLGALRKQWRALFQQRVRSGNITLIHGDLHLLGNLFTSKTTDAIRFIDWADCKPGLAPHDIAYCLISAPTPDRITRDTSLLRRYHQQLLNRGITGYGWDQCLWDYRFSLLTNLLQCVLQRSLVWFRKTMAIIHVWRCAELLSPPSQIRD